MSTLEALYFLLFVLFGKTSLNKSKGGLIQLFIITRNVDNNIKSHILYYKQ